MRRDLYTSGEKHLAVGEYPSRFPNRTNIKEAVYAGILLEKPYERFYEEDVFLIPMEFLQ